MSFIISICVFLTEVQSPLNEPVGIVHRFRRPFGAWVVAECSLFCFVGSAVLFGKSPIIMIPGRSNNAKHLAALKRHFDNVFVRKANGTFGREWMCNEDVHAKNCIRYPTPHSNASSGMSSTWFNKNTFAVIIRVFPRALTQALETNMNFSKSSSFPFLKPLT